MTQKATPLYLRSLHAEISYHLEQIEKLFKGKPKITLVVRNSDSPTHEKDVLMGNDSAEGAISAIRELTANPASCAAARFGERSMTQKSESVREAEQRPTIEDLVFEFARLHATACKVSQQALSDGFMLLVRNVIRLLSKEAEQEAARLDEELKLVEGMGWTEFSIWLREKAR